MSLFGPPDIQKLKSKGDSKGLIKALSYEKDPGVRQAAAEALAELGWKPPADESGAAYHAARHEWEACAAIGRPAGAALLLVMKDTKERIDTRTLAAMTLGGLGPPVVEPLIATLADKDSFGLAQAALVKLGEPAVRPLIAALNVKNELVQVNACEALTAVARAVGEPAIPVLIEEYKSASLDSGAAGFLPMVLSQLGSWVILPLISMLRGLKSPNEPEVCATAPLLVMGAAAVEPILGLLKDDSRITRILAIEMLKRIGDGRAVEPLRAVTTEDTDADVRSSAVEALEALGA